MVKRFLRFVKKHGLINDGDRVLLAVSGGVDSLVMVHLFEAASYAYGIAHCNFCLRGEASDGDAVFVEKLAKKLGVQFHLKNFDTGRIANERHISIQMAARDLRYQWFEGLSVQFGYNKVAVAHHLDDSIETVIYNLVRGTSIAGLRGILPKSRENVIRPLLEFEREELLAYARKNQIQWREDSSNAVTKYKRNYIRHELIPKFPELNPDFRTVMRDSLEKNREVEQVFLNSVGGLEKEILKKKEGEFFISKKSIREKGIGPYVLFHLIQAFGFNYHQCKDILEVMDLHAGKIFVSPSHRLLVDRSQLVIYENRKEYVVNEGGVQELSIGRNEINGAVVLIELLAMDEIEVKPDPNRAYLDADQIVLSLKVRKWQQGDWFVPLGMKGKKKLSDFMIDKKIPLNLKDDIRVVLSGEDIVWVVGERIDDRFKVTGQTKRILRMTWDNNYKNV